MNKVENTNYKVVNKFTIAIVIIALLLAGGVWFLYEQVKVDEYDKYRVVSNDNKEVGTTKTSINETSANFQALHYPKFEYDILNDEVDYIYLEVLEVIKNSDKGNKIFFLDYSSYKVFDSYITVQFKYEDIDKDKGVVDTKMYYINYDIKNDMILKGDDILRLDYKDKFSSNFSKEDISSNNISFDNFIIEKDKYKIITSDGSFDIKYETNREYIKLQNVNIPSLAPSQVIKPIKFNVDHDKKKIALTYDDGPSIHTIELLDMLKEQEVNVTFFLSGYRVEENSDIVKRMYEDGHLLASHGYTHDNLVYLSDNKLKDEVYDTMNAIFSVTGYDPYLIRPPYGEYDNRLVQLVGEENIITWNLDPKDWYYQDTQKVLAEMKTNAEDGSIIILHDLYTTSIEASELFIKEYKELGYQFVTLEDLYK